VYLFLLSSTFGRAILFAPIIVVSANSLIGSRGEALSSLRKDNTSSRKADCVGRDVLAKTPEGSFCHDIA